MCVAFMLIASGTPIIYTLLFILILYFIGALI